MKLRCSLGTLAGLILLVGFGCYGTETFSNQNSSDAGDGSSSDDSSSDDSGLPPDPGVPTIAEELVLVEETPCFESVESPDEFDEELATLTFQFTCSPDSAGIEVGSIVVGIEGGGYLRRVESITISGNTLVAHTSPAALSEVLHNMSFSEDLILEQGARGSMDFSGTILLADDNVYAQLRRGVFELAPRVHFESDFGWYDVESLNTRLDIDLAADIELFLRNNRGFQIYNSLPIATFSYPFVFSIGPVPVAGELRIDVNVGVWSIMPGTGVLTVGGTAGGELQIDASYSDEEGWSSRSKADFEAQNARFDFEILTDWTGKVFLRAEPQLSLYKTVHGIIRAETYVKADAQSRCDALAVSSAFGVDTRAIFKLQVFKKFGPQKHFPVKGWEWPLGATEFPWPASFVTDECATTELQCGSEVSYSTQWPGAQSLLSEYSCAPAGMLGSEMVYRFEAPAAGPSAVNIDTTFNAISWMPDAEMPVGAPAPAGYRGVVVIEDHGGVDQEACIAWEPSGEFSFNTTAGGVYWIVVDSVAGSEGGFDLAVSCDQQGGEQCDNQLDDDADGLIDCEDSDCAASVACSGGQCSSAGTIACGQSVSGNTATDSAATAALDGYPCNPGNYAGPEEVWSWTATASGPVEFRLVDPHPTSVDHDVFVLETQVAGCTPASCPDWGAGNAWGGNSLSFDAVAGRDYFFVVDGYNMNAGPFAATLDCNP